MVGLLVHRLAAV
jgi:hypothetical protein